MSVKGKEKELKAVVKGEETFTPEMKAEQTAIILVQERKLSSQATLTIEGRDLLGTGKLYVKDITNKTVSGGDVSGGDATTVATIGASDGALTFAVQYDHTYEISTDADKRDVSIDSENTKDVLVGEKGKTFTAGEKDAVIAVVVEKTVVNPTVTFVGPEGETLPDTLSVTLTPATEEKKPIEGVKAGDTPELEIGETYTATSSSEDFATAFKVKAEKTTTELKITFTKVDNTVHNFEVWDFGAEDLSKAKPFYVGEKPFGNPSVTNMIVNDATRNATDAEKAKGISTIKDINDQYGADVVGGTSGKNIPSGGLDFGADIHYNPNAATNHRYRTDNTSFTRTDNNIKTDIQGATHHGFVYSNTGWKADNNGTVRFEIKAEAGDIYTIYVGSNGGAAGYDWKSASNPDEAVQTGTYTGGQTKTPAGGTANIEPNTFYAASTGTYHLYCTNEKLVVSRIVRERPTKSTVSGRLLDGPATYPADANLVFTAYAEDDAEMEKPLGVFTSKIGADGSYSVALPQQYAYQVSLSGMDEYIVAKLGNDTTSVFALANACGNKEINITLQSVDLVKVTGAFKTNTGTEADNKALEEYLKKNALKLTFTQPEGKIYVPTLTYSGLNFTVTMERGVSYTLAAAEVDDYDLTTLTMATTVTTGKEETGREIVFTEKEKFNVDVKFADYSKYNYTTDAIAEGGQMDAAAAGVDKVSFSKLIVEEQKATLEKYTYEYTASNLTNVKLRPGQYRVKVTTTEEAGYAQELTKDVKITDAGVTCVIPMKSTAPAAEVAYKETVTVGAGKDYATINEALDAVRNMKRTGKQRVTFLIEPGTYDEMLRVDVKNVTFKNAADTPSIALKNNGVDIDEKAVRITSYYGVGYDYYSMTDGYLYSEDAFAVNTHNGYPSITNPSGGGTACMWNATVWVSKDGFQAEGIIFENAFNQYVSKKAAEDTLVAQGGAKEVKGAPRAGMAEGSTAVQQKAYVERAAAFAASNAVTGVTLKNCAVIGHQDTLYGGTGAHLEFENCSIYGGTDYIMGPMNAVFVNCDLVSNINTSDKNSNDNAFITAAQHTVLPGYLFYNCTVRDVEAGTEMAAAYHTAEGKDNLTYFGRTWNATGEALFYKTTIKSNVKLEEGGWTDGLTAYTDATRMMEYGTVNEAGEPVDISLRGQKLVKEGDPRTPLKGVYAFANAEALCKGLGIDYKAVCNAAGAVDQTLLDHEVLRYFKHSAHIDPPEEGVYEIDLSGGLVTGKTYADDMLWVMANMPALTNKDTGAVYVKGSANPKKDKKTAAGVVPDEGTVVVIKTPETYEGNKVIRFTVSSKASGKTFYLVSKDARERVNVVASYEGGSDPVGKKFVLDANKEYYFYASGSNQEIYKLRLEYKEIIRGNWAEVAAPEIKDVAIGGENNEKIVVKATGLIGDPGADSMYVEMYDEKGDLIETKTVTDDSDGVEPLSFEFVPTTSGKYSFRAALAREGEATKYSERSEALAFTYPLATPEFAAVTNKGADGDKAKLEVIWLKVSEARKYKVSVYQEKTVTSVSGGDTVSGTEKNVLAEAETTAREYTFDNLPKDETVIVSVVAVRAGDEDVSKPATREIKLTGEFDRTWIGASFGSNAAKTETAKVNDDGTITVDASSNTKIVPGSTDGLMYYYTKLDASENFTLTAKLKSVSYKPDNGQEGFGIMAADAVGEHGDKAAFWNNSYQIVASQMQYNWDPTVKDESGKYVGGITSLISDSETVFQNKMRLGIGWTLKEGVTYEDKQKIANGEIQQPDGWSSGTQGTLETSVPSAIMEALYKENLITNDSTPEQVQEAYKNYAGVYRGGSKKDDKNSTPYGQFNIIGGWTTAVSDTLRQIGDKAFDPVTEMIYQIQRNNTGYNLRYMNPAALELSDAEKAEYEAACTEDGKVKGTKAVRIGGKTVMKVNWSDGTSSYHEVLGSKVLYDDSRNSLSQIDMKNLYVGFFAARVTKVDVTKYGLETVSADDDFEAEEKVKEIVPLQARVLSAESSNSEKYELIFTANADGKLYVINKTEDGKTTAVASDYAITAGKRTVIGTRLKAGANNFEYVFKASKDYVPGENKVLDSFEAKGIYKVTLAAKGSETEIWVAPDGTSANSGADKEHPTDIYSAVAYAKPGQTIQLVGGEYVLGKDADGKGANQNILIARGIDGTKDKKIVMQSVDPANRAVLNFQGVEQSGAGLTLVANYWHLKNFDVTHSKNGQDGVLVSGKNNVVEGLHAYENGNTGIQLSRYGSDGRDLWPANNLILNCTSYLNYDEGYQDADGFAAKLTVGEGNRFSGCVAAYNADDGWDLFSKVQTGNIGAVTIENCVAYKNGLLLGKDKTTTSPAVIDYAGKEFEAGNGNGFKMGGDGMSGHHVLRNSVAFDNLANGIDSNSCPDIEVYNCISFNNNTNLALSNYDSSVNSAYIVKNLLSVDGLNKDSVRMLGRQITGNIYNTTNYFWDGDNAYKYDGSPSKKVGEALPAASVIFESTNPADAGVNPAAHQFIARKANGSIDLGSFLKLKAGYTELGGQPGDTDPEKEVNRKTPEIAVFATSTQYLSDVVLPDALKDEYEWVYPMTLTAPFAGTKAELDIRKKDTTGEGDATVIVDFVELTGVNLTLSGNQLVGADGSLTMTAEPVYVPAELPCKLSEVQGGSISVTFNDKGKFGLTVTKAVGTEGVENVGVVTRGSGAKQGRAKYTATMTLDAKKRTTVTSADKTFETWPVQYAFSFTEIATENVTANLTKLRFAKAGETAQLQGLTVSNVVDSKGNAKTEVKVTSGDAKVAKVTSSAGVWTVTAVAPGATYLTLTAAADKNATLTIPVIVEGEAYAINASMLTIDRAKTTGATFRALGMTGADPSGELVVKAVYKGANKVPGKAAEDTSVNKSSLKIENTIGSFYTITAIDKDNEGKAIDMIKSGTYTIVLASAADQNLTFDPFTLKVIETKPTVTFKQTKKVNMYYTAGTNSNTGFVTATSKFGKVNLTQNDPEGSAFRLVKSGSGYNIVLKDAAGADFASGKKINNKIAVTASFDGYKESYSKGAVGASDEGRTVINVSVVTQAPKYVLEIDNKIFYEKLGINSTEIRVFDKTSGTYVKNAEIELANTKAGYKSKFDNVNKKFYMIDDTLYLDNSVRNNKGGTAKIRVVHPEFAKDKRGYQNEVILNAPISLNTNNPSVTVKKMTLTCRQNGADGMPLAGVEQAGASIVVRNAMGYSVRNVELDPKNNAKAKALLPYLDVDWGENGETGEQMLYVSLKDPDPVPEGATPLPELKDALGKGKTVAPGTYAYDAEFTLNNMKVKGKVSVAIVDQPTATARVKGSLDILDRGGSKLTVTGSLRNMNGQIVGMRFGNDSTLKKNASQYKPEWAAANLFDIEWKYDNATKQGCAIVTLKEDASYRVNGKYKVTPIFQIATGSGVVEVAAKPITIVTKQTAVKFKSVPVLEAKLSKPDVPGTANMTLGSPANLVLNEMEQLTMKDNFELDYDPNSGDISVSIINCAGLKANKIYTVKLGVNPEGAGSGTKQQTITVKVRVIN